MSPVGALIYELLYRLNPTWPNRLDDWLDRRYYASCGKWHWRFWFEVTGQGRAARRYMRVLKKGRREFLRSL